MAICSRSASTEWGFSMNTQAKRGADAVDYEDPVLLCLCWVSGSSQV